MLYERLRAFFISHGLSPDVRFADVQSVRLILVAADLNAGQPLLYGVNPQQSVLDGLLASTALPPWVRPLERGGHYLMDGGVVSNLPVELALSQWAQEITALDLADPRNLPAEGQGFGRFVEMLVNTVEQRQTELELALATAWDVPVHRVILRADVPVARWDFGQTDSLIVRGYEITRQQIEQWRSEHLGWWRKWMPRVDVLERVKPKTIRIAAK